MKGMYRMKIDCYCYKEFHFHVWEPGIGLIAIAKKAGYMTPGNISSDQRYVRVTQITARGRRASCRRGGRRVWFLRAPKRLPGRIASAHHVG